MSKLTVIMYHYVRALAASRYPGIKGLDLYLFRAQLDFIQSHFNLVCTEQVLAKQLPPNAALLTFDDGYIDHYTNVFPLLKQRKIAGFFSMPAKILSEGKLLDVNKIHFILAAADIEAILSDTFALLDYYRGSEYPIEPNEVLYQKLAQASRYDNEKVVFIKRLLQNHLDEQLRNTMVGQLFSKYISLSENAFAKELYMSHDQVRLMKDEGMFFGLHGYDHYWLGKMKPDQMQADIDRALEVFDSVLDRQNWVMCFPYGSYSGETLQYIAQKGCRLGFTTEVATADLDRCNPLLIPRLDTNDFPPKSDHYLEIQGL